MTSNSLRAGAALAAGLALVIAVSGCGTRPGRLQPPSGKAAIRLYPRTYPDPKTLDNGLPVPQPATPPSGNTVTMAPDTTSSTQGPTATTEAAPPGTTGAAASGNAPSDTATSGAAP